jgi:putative FmdB family regulatory protein
MVSMPTYIYRCSHCKHQFEKVQKFSDPPIERCPNCRRKGVRKVLVPPSVQFKGSGWYITDSKGSGSANSGKSSKKEAPTESKAADSTSTTTESKSDKAD